MIPGIMHISRSMPSFSRLVLPSLRPFNRFSTSLDTAWVPLKPIFQARGPGVPALQGQCVAWTPGARAAFQHDARKARPGPDFEPGWNDDPEKERCPSSLFRHTDFGRFIPHALSCYQCWPSSAANGPALSFFSGASNGTPAPCTGRCRASNLGRVSSLSRTW